jgi:hypothetical protein
MPSRIFFGVLIWMVVNRKFIFSKEPEMNFFILKQKIKKIIKENCASHALAQIPINVNIEILRRIPRGGTAPDIDLTFGVFLAKAKKESI